MIIYEGYDKLQNGKWCFVGIFDEKQYHLQDKFLINERNAYGCIYRTYKWLNGKIETKRFKKYGEE